MRIVAITIGILCLFSSASRACLNDRDVAGAEQEFKSAYLDHKSSTVGAAQFPLAVAETIGGALFVAGSAYLLLKPKAPASTTQSSDASSD